MGFCLAQFLVPVCALLGPTFISVLPAVWEAPPPQGGSSVSPWDSAQPLVLHELVQAFMSFRSIPCCLQSSLPFFYVTIYRELYLCICHNAFVSLRAKTVTIILKAKGRIAELLILFL